MTFDLPKSQPIINLANLSNESPCEPILHKYYVGIDIGYRFHVAACIPPANFLDRKEIWKKTKTLKFFSTSEGLSQLLSSLNSVSVNPKDFFILMEPTGGHYGYALMSLLINKGYTLHYVENKGVKDFRERFLNIREKTDQIDARVMAYMGFHKVLNPSLGGIRLVKPTSPVQTILKSLTRDRWLLSKQLTRVKNQVLQLFAVTNPELKNVFTQPTRPSILKFVKQYPTVKEIADITEDDIRVKLIKSGANKIAKTAAIKLKQATSKSSAIIIDSPHIIMRQNWLIDEALRMQESIHELEISIHELINGNEKKKIEPHPYRDILFSFPTMSDTWAATLIGIIGDVERFPSYRDIKSYLGFSPSNASSGTSVDKTRLSYEGVRDSRRVLFQMTLVLISPRVKPNPFKAMFNRLTQERTNRMPKMKAIGHVCGKIVQILYGCLKTNTLYDPIVHAKRCNLPIDETYVTEMDIPEDVDDYEEEAERLADNIVIED